jgi:hypothetical protein
MSINMPERGPSFSDEHTPEVAPTLKGSELVDAMARSYRQERQSTREGERNAQLEKRILTGFNILALPHDELVQAAERIEEIGGHTATRIEKSIQVAAQLRTAIIEKRK